MRVGPCRVSSRPLLRLCPPPVSAWEQRKHACGWTALGEQYQPLHLFETGNILLYLAERSGKFLPTDPAAKAECLNWLFFNVRGRGGVRSSVGPLVAVVDGEFFLRWCRGYPLTIYFQYFSVEGNRVRGLAGGRADWRGRRSVLPLLRPCVPGMKPGVQTVCGVA